MHCKQSSGKVPVDKSLRVLFSSVRESPSPPALHERVGHEGNVEEGVPYTFRLNPGNVGQGTAHQGSPGR